MVTGSRRAVALKVELSSSSQGKKPKGGGATTRSAEQSTNVVRSARSLATALSNLNLKVFPQDGTVLPLGEPSEVVQVLQGGVLRCYVSCTDYFPTSPFWGATVRQWSDNELRGDRGSGAPFSVGEGSAPGSKVGDPRSQRQSEGLEKTVEASSADALAVSQKNQELGEEISALKAAS
ncbi:hypothetical protein Bca4012_083782 [Brassica carinata]